MSKIIVNNWNTITQFVSWYRSWPYAYRWDADRYMVHIYCLNGSIDAYQLKIESHIKVGMGDSSFYLVYAVWGPDRYIIYRRQVMNWFTRRVGLDNCYCNYLAIYRYFFRNNFFQSWIKYILLFFEKLNYSTAFFPVYNILYSEQYISHRHRV